MENFEILDLEYKKGNNFRVNNEYLESYKIELLKFLNGQDDMKTKSFAKQVMMLQEIKANNSIEGINNDISIIDEVINSNSLQSLKERKKIINLYQGYQYILEHKDINKESLKELYSILSDGLLESYDLSNMGEYYRNKPVYILKGNHLNLEPYKGMDENKLDYYMDLLFEYINNIDKNNCEIDYFIKSQIMHFYFVYIHPYFDVNGRTSRTVAMWYLLNNESYPYIIFNRAIAFAKREYERNIIKVRNSGDMTLFLKYMLVSVEKELEKEYLIKSIKSKSKYELTKEDLQILEYFISMKSHLTVKDLATTYNYYNEYKKINDIFRTKIMPLIDKEILVVNGYTSRSKQSNMNLRLNEELISVDESKVKNLNLSKYIK